MNETFRHERPNGFKGSGDSYLLPMIYKLENLITAIEFDFIDDELIFDFDNDEELEIAHMIIEFAEDLHNDIGIWKSLENYNKLMFNTPLPLFVDENYEINEIFDKNRIKFFIYNIFLNRYPGIYFSPKHINLELLSQGISDFLNKNFKTIPKNSGVKKFLAQPNKYGWDVKNKLVWLGTKSYLFRDCYHFYFVDNVKFDIKNQETDIVELIDEFICEKNTIWSGLGVIDILAKVLNLPQNLQDDIRNWYERLYSIYRVNSYKNGIMEIENILNEQIYNAKIEFKNYIFSQGDFIIGYLVAYDNIYYWSGVQNNLGYLDILKLSDFINVFAELPPERLYRFDKKLLAQAIENLKSQNDDFISYFGSDLMIFKNGQTMLKEFKTKDTLYNKSKIENYLRKFNGKEKPNIPEVLRTLPSELLNSQNSIGVHFDPQFGIEIQGGFDNLMTGFLKNGVDLFDYEIDSIIYFVEDEQISANFVYKMIEMFGYQSILVAFELDDNITNIEFLLHKFKGQCYRNVYPNIIMIDDKTLIINS